MMHKATPNTACVSASLSEITRPTQQGPYIRSFLFDIFDNLMNLSLSEEEKNYRKKLFLVSGFLTRILTLNLNTKNN